jgi:hypothetical protein
MTGPCAWGHSIPPGWGGWRGLSRLLPPTPVLPPGLLTCTDACRRTAGTGCAAAHTAPAGRRQGGHVLIFCFRVVASRVRPHSPASALCRSIQPHGAPRGIVW